MAESTHPADLSKSAPGIDTTQPAGALPEPTWPCSPAQVRALMAERDAARAQSERWQKSVDALRDERDALRRELEELRAQPATQTRLLVERATALEKCIAHAFDNLAAEDAGIAQLKIHARAAAQQLASAACVPTKLPKLRIVMSEHCIDDPDGMEVPISCTCHNEDGSVTLYARPIPSDARAPDCTDGDGHVYAAVSRAHATPEQNAAVEASIERVVAFAREGREPLTLLKGLAGAMRDRNYGRMPEDVQRAYDAAWGYLCGLGTSADGETQP